MSWQAFLKLLIKAFDKRQYKNTTSLTLNKLLQAQM